MADLELRVRAFDAVHGVLLRDVDVPRMTLLRDAWSDLLTEEAISGTRFSLEAAGSDPGVWVARVTEQLTRSLLERGDRAALFLHASAVAAPDGGVLGFLGPSGAGKTTLAQTLGRALGYVTDESLAIHRDGRVSAYRKPLSVVHDPQEPKRQISPAAAMAPLPNDQLQLAALCLANRDVTATSVEVSVLPLATAVLRLVPQTSYLSQLPDPLATIATLLERTGGLRALRYREAKDVLQALDDIRACRAPSSRWRPVRRTSAAVAHVADAIEVDDGCLVFDGDQVVHLVGVGATIWLATAAGQDPTAAVIAAHGVPVQVDARTGVGDRIVQLRDLGVIRDTTTP